MSTVFFFFLSFLFFSFLFFFFFTTLNYQPLSTYLFVTLSAWRIGSMGSSRITYTQGNPHVIYTEYEEGKMFVVEEPRLV